MKSAIVFLLVELGAFASCNVHAADISQSVEVHLGSEDTSTLLVQKKSNSFGQLDSQYSSYPYSAVNESSVTTSNSVLLNTYASGVYFSPNTYHDLTVDSTASAQYSMTLTGPSAGVSVPIVAEGTFAMKYQYSGSEVAASNVALIEFGGIVSDTLGLTLSQSAPDYIGIGLDASGQISRASLNATSFQVQSQGVENDFFTSFRMTFKTTGSFIFYMGLSSAIDVYYGSSGYAHATLDPYMYIDPVWASQHPGYSLLSESGIPNDPVSSVPEASSWISLFFGLFLLLMGGRWWRG